MKPSKILIDSINKNSHFVYLSINHGFWEMLYRIKKKIDPQEINKNFFKHSHNDFDLDRKLAWYEYNGFIKLLDILKKKFYKNVFFNASNQSFPYSDKLFGTPFLGKNNINQIIKKFNNKNNLKKNKKFNFSGYDFKQMIVDNEFYLFINKLKKKNILYIGPSNTHNFLNNNNLKGSFFQIPKKKAMHNINIIIQELKKNFDLNFDVILCSAGANTTLIYDSLKKLIHDKKIKFYDIGIVPEVLMLQRNDPFVNFFYAKIVKYWKKINKSIYNQITYSPPEKGKIGSLNFNEIKNYKTRIINKPFNFFEKNFFSQISFQNIIGKNCLISQFESIDSLIEELSIYKNIGSKILIDNVKNFTLINNNNDKIIIDLNHLGLTDFERIYNLPLDSWSIYYLNNNITFNDKNHIESIRKFCSSNNKILLIDNSYNFFSRINNLNDNEFEVLKVDKKNPYFYKTVKEIYLISNCNFNSNNLIKKKSFSNINKNKSLFMFFKYYNFYFQGQKRKIISVLNDLNISFKITESQYCCFLKVEFDKNIVNFKNLSRNETYIIPIEEFCENSNKFKNTNYYTKHNLIVNCDLNLITRSEYQIRKTFKSIIF